MQKAKGKPIIRVVAGSTAKVFELASNDAREAFLAVVNPIWKAAAQGNNSNPASHIPTKEIQQAVFEANADLKSLHAR